MTDPHNTLDLFREMTSKEVYSEMESPLHNQLISQIIPGVMRRPDAPKPGEKLVDIGCGAGVVLDKLVELGLNKEDLVGTTMGEDDRKATEAKGYKCYDYDMTFTGFESNSFDYAIVRHCLEHSLWPYMTLMEFNRIMKTGGRMYIEMPAPDGDRRLEHWANHYAVMGRTMWGSLMIRSGFYYQSGVYDFSLNNSENPEKPIKEPYHWYVLTKVVDRQDYKPATSEYMAELQEKIRQYELSLKSVDKK